MEKLKSICVFCGSRVGTNPQFKRAAIELGKLFVKKEIELVYGGGRIGLMGILADTILNGGGRVVGVIPSFLEKLEIGNNQASELIVTSNMHTRKETMFEKADAFITLAGGIGTLEETFEIATWKQLKIHSKPIVILNTDGCWSGLENIIENIVVTGFADPSLKNLFGIVTTPEGIFELFEEHTVSNKK